MMKSPLKQAALCVLGLSLLPLSSGSFAAENNALEIKAFNGWELSVGYGKAVVNDESSDVTLLPPNSKIQVPDTEPLLFSVRYAFRPNWSITFFLGEPIDLEGEARGALAAPVELGGFGGTVDLANADSYPATIFLDYYFGSPNDRFQPFISIGGTYTAFTNERAFATLEAGLMGETEVDLDNSIDWAFRTGVRWNFDKNQRFFGQLDLAYLYIETDVDIVTQTQVAPGVIIPIERDTKLQLDSFVFAGMIGYRF